MQLNLLVVTSPSTLPCSIQLTLHEFFETPKPEDEEIFWGDGIHSRRDWSLCRNYASVQYWHILLDWPVAWLPTTSESEQSKKACSTTFPDGSDGVLLQQCSLWTWFCLQARWYPYCNNWQMDLQKYWKAASLSILRGLVNGQVSASLLNKKAAKRLSIITAYRSPHQQLKDGFGFYDQWYALLLASGVTTPNVRTQFVRNIVKFIQELQRKVMKSSSSLIPMKLTVKIR